MKKSFKIMVVAVLFLAGVVRIDQNSVQAMTISYNLEFTGSLFNFGSGFATFDDTPAGAGITIAGSTKYNFIELVGSGDNGNWQTSAFEYNSSNGESDWYLVTDLGAILTYYPSVGVGLAPIDALEQKFALLSDLQWLTWSRVPEPATLILLGSGLLGLLAGRKMFKR